jgi:HEAT repeat protein
VKEMEGFAALKNGEIDRVIEMDVHAVLRESRDLDRIKKVRTRAALDDLLRGSQATRAGALEAFRDLGPAVAPVLLASLGKVPREAGAELVKCLVETMDSAQLPSLLAHLLENGDLQQRMIALAAVRRVKPASGRALLAKACQDPSAVIRRRVITCLSWYRTPWAIGLIKELAYDEDAGVRSAASEISALVSRIGNTNRIERA